MVILSQPPGKYCVANHVHYATHYGSAKIEFLVCAPTFHTQIAINCVCAYFALRLWKSEYTSLSSDKCRLLKAFLLLLRWHEVLCCQSESTTQCFSAFVEINEFSVSSNRITLNLSETMSINSDGMQLHATVAGGNKWDDKDKTMRWKKWKQNRTKKKNNCSFPFHVH